MLKLFHRKRLWIQLTARCSSVTDETQYVDKARVAAIKDAVHEAQASAAALGVVLGPIVSVEGSRVSPGSERNVQYDLEASSENEPYTQPYVPSLVRIGYAVEIVYQLKQ
jgi:uncharacterized protein YggE